MHVPKLGFVYGRLADLWSIDGEGMPVVSYVLNGEFDFDSAY